MLVVLQQAMGHDIIWTFYDKNGVEMSGGSSRLYANRFGIYKSTLSFIELARQIASMANRFNEIKDDESRREYADMIYFYGIIIRDMTSNGYEKVNILMD